MAADEANPKGASKPGTGARGPARRDKPPVTIDLEANAVSAAEASSEAHAASAAAGAEGESPKTSSSAARETSGEAPAMPAATEDRPRLLMLGLAGAAGGLIVLILGFGLQAAGVLPAPGRSAATEALAEASGLASTVTGFDQRVTAIEAASAQTIADRALLDDLSRQVGVVDAFGTSLSDRLLNVEAKIASLGESLGSAGEAATRQSLDALAERVGRLEVAPPAAGGEATSVPALAELGSRVEADRAALETLRGRVDTLASDVAALQAKLDGVAKTPAAVTDGERAARAIAIGSLRQASARGGPFAADLAVIGALGIGAADLAALAPLADRGAPGRAALLVEFPAVADRILAAGQPAGEGAGIFDRVLSYGRGLVKIRPTGPISGSDPVAVVSRMQAAIEDGDFAAALAEREALPPAGQAASEEWAAEVSDRLAIDRLVDDIANALGATEGSG
jgi:hypothetical protein